MSKVLFYTDFHLTAKTPRHRKDNFSQSLIAKLSEIYSIAKSENVECVIFGGDFYNNHRIFNYDIINKAMKIICTFYTNTYAVIGQHDLVGHNKATYKSSTLAFMEYHCNMFSTLWKPIELSNVFIYPCHWFDDFEETLAQPLSRKKKSILVAHQTVSDISLPYNTYQTKEMSTNFNLVLTGDWHNGYDPHEVDGTIWCNPGSISRLAITDAVRTPQVALITIEKGKDIEIELIELESACLSEDVFEVSFLDEIREKAEMDSDKFIESIMDLEQESVDVFDLIDKIGKQKGIRKEVLDYIATKNTA